VTDWLCRQRWREYFVGAAKLGQMRVSAGIATLGCCLALVLLAADGLQRLPLPRSTGAAARSGGSPLQAGDAAGAETAATTATIISSSFEGDWSPPDVGWDIWTGSVIAVLPIIYASVLFYERIETQRACLVCAGKGLVYKTKQGSELSRPRKCYNCGGLLPWLGWRYFWFTTIFDVGNGGALQNVSKDYDQVGTPLTTQ